MKPEKTLLERLYNKLKNFKDYSMLCQKLIFYNKFTEKRKPENATLISA